jgi:hypothetical protein
MDLSPRLRAKNLANNPERRFASMIADLNRPA